MKRMVQFLAAILLASLVGACISTSTASYTAPSHRNSSLKSKRVLVMYNDRNIGLRRAAETAMVAALRKNGVNADNSMDLLPPGKLWHRRDVQAAAQSVRHKYEYFFAMGGALGVDKSYVPPTYVPGQSSSQVNVIGNTAYVTTTTTPGYTIGGGVVHLPRGRFAAWLHKFEDLRTDGKSSPAVWKSQTGAGGSRGVDFIELTKRAVSETMQQLKKDGLL